MAIFSTSWNDIVMFSVHKKMLHSVTIIGTQVNGVYSGCVRICPFRPLPVEKPAPHSLQVYGFSPV